MTDDELTEYAYLLNDAIAGKWVTYYCPNYRRLKRAFNELCKLADYMGLAYKAYRQQGHEQIIVGDSLQDGGIDFECRTHSSEYRSMRRAGDPRAVFDLPKMPDVHMVKGHFDYWE